MNIPRVDSACVTIVRTALEVVRPNFRHDYHHGIHGVAHWSRVWLHGRAIARSLDVDPRIVAWFAYLHDSQRHDDGIDRGHGSRAADFAVRLRRQGAMAELDGTAFEQLCEAMRLHSDGHTENEPAIRACWDADRLDLGRVGITPQPRYLCTDHGKAQSTIAYALTLTDVPRALRRSRRRD